MSDKTLEYYNANAEKFVESTLSVDFSQVQSEFLNLLMPESYILDFGCGSGRDMKYFLEHGYRVDAVDGSAKLCRIASEFTGIQVHQMLFQELQECHVRQVFRGIKSIPLGSVARIIFLQGRRCAAIVGKHFFLQFVSAHHSAADIIPICFKRSVFKLL